MRSSSQDFQILHALEPVLFGALLFIIQISSRFCTNFGFIFLHFWITTSAELVSLFDNIYFFLSIISSFFYLLLYCRYFRFVACFIFAASIISKIFFLSFAIFSGIVRIYECNFCFWRLLGPWTCGTADISSNRLTPKWNFIDRLNIISIVIFVKNYIS